MSVSLIVIGIIVLLFALLVLREYWLYSKLEYKLHKRFPSRKTKLFFGTIWELCFSNPEKTFQLTRRLAKELKTTYSQWWNGYLILNITVGPDAEYILNSSKCLNKSFIYDYLHPFLGTGLLTSGNKKWQYRRKLLTPAFHFNILQQQFHKIFKNETDQLIETIKQNDNNVIHLQDCMSQFTLNTICETAMGVKQTSAKQSDKYRRQIYEIGEMLVYRLMRPWLRTNIICKLSGFTKKFDEVLLPVHNFTRHVIRERRQMFQNNQIRVEFNNDDDNEENIYETKKIRYAMLDTLLDAEARGEQIDDEGIREEVNTFLFEGHDTTSTALTFTLFLLAENPEIQEKVYDEVLAFANSHNIDAAKMNDLNQLKYLDRVLKECLRIYPPVTFISRIATDEVPFDDLVLPPETNFNFFIYDIHHDANQFPDPEKFDPDRFLPEQSAKRHPYAYIPFSAGPRNCIGQKFALLEIKTVLIRILLNFQLEQVTKRSDLVFIADLVLRTKNPILVKFNLRK